VRVVGIGLLMAPKTRKLFILRNCEREKNLKYAQLTYTRGRRNNQRFHRRIRAVTIATTANSAARSRRSRTSHPSLRSGGASTASPTLPSLQRQPTRKPFLSPAASRPNPRGGRMLTGEPL
jgi:hypothetical protein